MHSKVTLYGLYRHGKTRLSECPRDTPGLKATNLFEAEIVILSVLCLWVWSMAGLMPFSGHTGDFNGYLVQFHKPLKRGSFTIAITL